MLQSTNQVNIHTILWFMDVEYVPELYLQPIREILQSFQYFLDVHVHGSSSSAVIQVFLVALQKLIVANLCKGNRLEN